jgi:hypothetical protein
MRPTRVLLSTAPMLALLTLTPAGAAAQDRDNWLEHCRRNQGDDRVTFCDEREVRLPARGSLGVDGATNGGVAVKAWDRDEILVRERIQASGRTMERARQIAAGIRVDTDGEIRASGPATPGRNESWSVSYEIFVPRRTNLQITTNNGPIAVERVSGEMSLRVQNGPLVLTAVSGDVHGRATNGPLVVTLEGSRWSGAGLDAETTNGPVNLTIPDGYNTRLTVGTVNGPMNVDLPRATDRGRRGRRIETTLGSGGAPVRAVTTNGPVVVRGG